METRSFAELGLSAKVLAAIQAAGYTSPTPIQAEAIPIAVAGQDVLGIAQTGTGKTASFVLPMLTRLETGRARSRMPRSLILCPTRELAAQCALSFETYGAKHKLTVALLIGGVSFDDQLRKLDRGADVLIATPGRMLDHFQRGKLLLTGVEILVIDEADRMLDMGFIPDIERICKLLPPSRQTLFFSATMPPEITRLVDQFLRHPVRVEVAPPATTAKTITQRFAFTENSEDWAKREALRGLLESQSVRNAIIFCNRKRDVAILFKSMIKHGFNAGSLHGDMDQSSRTTTLQAFRDGKITYLIASDVAARGLDIPDVSHVFNFDVPWQSDDYVHRIGRTGRAGREGFAVSIVTADDLKSVLAIEKMLGTPIEWIGEAPTPETLAEAPKRRRSGRRSGPPQREERGASARRDRPRGRERAPAPPRVAAVEGEPIANAAPREARTANGNGHAEVREGRDSRPPRRRRPERSEATSPRPAPARETRPQPEPRDAEPRQRHGSEDRPQRGADRPENRPRAPRAPQPQAAEGASERAEFRPARNGQPSDRPRGDRNDRSNLGPAVVGLGDHVPAFLRRPSRVARP